jgi:hypothetical protein
VSLAEITLTNHYDSLSVFNILEGSLPVPRFKNSECPFFIILFQMVKMTSFKSPRLADYSHQNLTSAKLIFASRNLIEDIDFKYNNFQTFTGFPAKIIGLHHLDLCVNQLSSFEGFPISLPDLEGLYLAFNQLTALPLLGSISPNLERLVLTNNQIQHLSNLSSLSKLRFLYLNNNKVISLEGLPPVLSLKVLHASGNNLENFSGFPTLPSDQIPTFPNRISTDLDIDLQFYDNPLRSLHGIPRYFLHSAVKSFLLTDQNRRNPKNEPITKQDHAKRLQSFQFSPRGLELIKYCLHMDFEYQYGYPISQLETPLTDVANYHEWIRVSETERSTGFEYFNRFTNRWAPIDDTDWFEEDNLESPITQGMRFCFRYYQRHGTLSDESSRFGELFGPRWYDAYDALYAYYQDSPIELAQFYIQDQQLLTDEERDRLVHEATKTIRDMLELALPSSDPVLKAIVTRTTVPGDSGFSLLL